MKNIYPVIFTMIENGVLVEVPDLEILTQGEDIENAIYMARDAIELLCIDLEDEGKEIKSPSKFSDIDITKGTFYNEGETIISLVDIDSIEYRRKIDTKAVYKNVTIPS